MELLTASEVASQLGVTTDAVYRLCDRKRPMIRHHRIGTARATIRIPADALAEYLAAAEVRPAESPPPLTPPPRRYVPQSLRY
jgi:excisionase family DNA binding protein